MDIDHLAVQAREWVNHDRERRSVIMLGLERNADNPKQISLTFCMSGNDKNLRSSLLNAMQSDEEFRGILYSVLSIYALKSIHEEE